MVLLQQATAYYFSQKNTEFLSFFLILFFDIILFVFFVSLLCKLVEE